MTRSEKVTHIALITLAVAGLGAMVTQRLGIRLPGERAPKITLVRHIGWKLSPKIARWERADRNIVLAVRSDCAYCIASLAFYRRIAKVTKQPDSRLALHVVGQEEPQVLRDMFASNGIAVTSIERVTLQELGVVGTPTILVVDSNGAVVDELVGALTGEREQSFLTSLAHTRRRPVISGE